MRAEVWVLDGDLTEDQVKSLVGDLAIREVEAGLRETPSGRVLVVENPPEDLERPAGVLRASSIEIPDASHIMHEENAPAVNEAIVGFLRRHSR